MDIVEKGVKEVIAQNSRYAFDEIELTDPIDKFISSFMADRLARELKRKFPQVKTTELTNDLFTVLRRIQDIVTRINAYSN